MSLFRVADQDNVGVGVPTNQSHLAAVEGPLEVSDKFRFEIGDLSSVRAIEWLEPEIARILVPKGINHGFAVVGKASGTVMRALQCEKSRVLRRIDGYQR